MLWRDVINLIAVTSTATNDYGDPIDTESSRKIFANKKSIRQSEFYQAMGTGLKPVIMFEVRSIDYANEETLLYNSVRYKIEREYSKNGEISELICTGLVI